MGNSTQISTFKWKKSRFVGTDSPLVSAATYAVAARHNFDCPLEHHLPVPLPSLCIQRLPVYSPLSYDIKKAKKYLKKIKVFTLLTGQMSILRGLNAHVRSLLKF